MKQSWTHMIGTLIEARVCKLLLFERGPDVAAAVASREQQGVSRDVRS